MRRPSEEAWRTSTPTPKTPPRATSPDPKSHWRPAAGSSPTMIWSASLHTEACSHLDGCAECDNLVWVDSLEGLLAEELLYRLLHLWHARHTAHQNDLEGRGARGGGGARK
eukprot:scaffold28898_cov84-Isochrysis_galbana.AAC.2